MTTADVQIEGSQHFGVPLWTVDLSSVLDPSGPLVAEALDHLRATYRPEYPYRESSAGLERSAPSWAELVPGLHKIAQGVIDRAFRVPNAHRITSVRSWVVETLGPADYRPRRGEVDLFHNHTPAALSSVLYLRVPPEYESSEAIGTAFRAPAAALLRQLATPTHHVVAATTATMVIFPGWLEHSAVAPSDDSPFSTSRLVIATDFRCDG